MKVISKKTFEGIGKLIEELDESGDLTEEKTEEVVRKHVTSWDDWGVDELTQLVMLYLYTMHLAFISGGIGSGCGCDKTVH